MKEIKIESGMIKKHSQSTIEMSQKDRDYSLENATDPQEMLPKNK